MDSLDEKNPRRGSAIGDGQRHLLECAGIDKSESSDSEADDFFWYLGITYTAFAVMGIRRQVKGENYLFGLARAYATAVGLDVNKLKKKTDDVSFARLLAELADEPALSGNPEITRTMVEGDLIKLKSATESCEHLADRVLGHCDARGPKTLPKFRDVDNAIDTLHELYLKYNRLLLADGLTTLQPTYQYDWQEIFDYRWRLPEREAA